VTSRKCQQKNGLAILHDLRVLWSVPNRPFSQVVTVGSMVLAASCQRTPPPNAASQPRAVEMPSAPNTTPEATLSAGGCTINLPGRWNRIQTSNDHGYWSTQSEDGTLALDVLPMPWNTTDIREGIDAILDTRRGVDAEQNGPNVILSKKEFFENSGWYVLSNVSEGYAMATMVKVTPKLACALFLSRNGGDDDEFRKYAKSVLQAVTVER
jgi:hypothetical protein